MTQIEGYICIETNALESREACGCCVGVLEWLPEFVVM
jgi:hypothetical protein